MKNTTYYAALVFLSCSFAFGQTQEKVLWSFGTDPNDGSLPNGGLVFDKAGNLYGTTQRGGSVCSEDCGTAFELSPLPDGTWQETILYNFCSGGLGNACPDGQSPHGGLILDAKGNLYGMTTYGGYNASHDGYGGTVFELSPPSAQSGNWTETVLWNFGSPGDGAYPYGKLAFDAAGNLYGTTSETVTSGLGAVFELSPSPSGWTEKVLYTFCPNYPDCSDGETPLAGVTFDKSGNLYGTTTYGGCCSLGWGVVYQLSPSQTGWTETVLHRFTSTGGYPRSEVNFDQAGNLYGTDSGGNDNKPSCGGVFRMSPTQGGWKNYGAFSFNNSGVSGCEPWAAVYVDSTDGAVFGTTSEGGSYSAGTAFKLTQHGHTVVQEILYDFCQETGCADGIEPDTFLTPSSGQLYGTTASGGTGSGCGLVGFCGVVFQITP
jgi:uncharacterized repeat protein (TIGR03803 family)